MYVHLTDERERTKAMLRKWNDKAKAVWRAIAKLEGREEYVD